jgi:DNA polymerase-1
MKLMALDGNSLINRSFYGIRPLSTRDGLCTNAIYGFLTTLSRLTEEEQPDALCVTFDRREPTFRHKADAAYKAQRKPMPEELAMQVPVLKQVLNAMNIPRYELVGYEADDLLGTISCKCESAGWECVIVTGDKDSLQLITDHTKIKLVTTRMGQTTTKDMTPATFQAAYGFAPPQMVDLKALMGDASDNITGVPGVGEKTAMALVQRYGPIDTLYARLPDIDAKPGVIKKLQEGQDNAQKSHYLATIITDVPMDFAPEENLRQPYGEGLYDLFLRLEFTKLIEKWGLAKTGEPAQPYEGTCSSETVAGEGRCKALLADFAGRERVYVLTLPELDGVAVDNGEQMSLFFADRLGEAYLPFLRGLFGGGVHLVSHQVKELIRLLQKENLPAEGFAFDTALAAYLLDPTQGSYDLSRLTVSYCNFELPPQKNYTDPDAWNPLADRSAALGALMSYTAALAALYEVMAPQIEARGIHELFYGVEMPLCAVLAGMERAGFRVDGKALAAFGENLKGRMAALEKSIYEAAGQTFNINSPKQLGEILFEKLSLPHGKKTKTGYSTNADVLEKLRWEAPIVADILEYRQYAKLKSTYADGLVKVIEPDGRIRTSFQMTVTATGRLSSTEPNLQNIPTRTDLGSEIRKMFVAGPGNVLVDADYSQIELRLLAHIAGDESMRQAFLSGADIHTATASQVFHVPPQEVTHEMRRRAKAVNFGIVYGISAFSLSQDIGVTQKEAKAYMERYFDSFPGVRQYMTQIVETARQQGYVETLYHRRRPLPELKSSNFNMRSFGERVALNMPIQGTAADIMKRAMVRVDRRLRREGLAAKLIMQVHDELIVECPIAEAAQVEKLLDEEMEHAAEVSVPLIAEAHSGGNWLAAK